MSEPSKKSSGKLIALAVVVIIAAGAFFGVSWWEKDQARQIEEAIKAASGSSTSVKVGFWDKSAVITGLKINRSYPGMFSFALDAETLTLSGVNSGALIAKGAVPLADSVAMSNVKMVVIPPAVQSDSPLGIRKREISITSGVLTGLRGDLAGLVAELERIKSVQDLAHDQQALLRLITIAKGLHADSVSISGYETRDDMGLPTPVVSTIESQQVKDFSLLTCGLTTWKNIKVSAMGQDMIKIETMGLQRMAIPDIFTPIVSAMPPDGRGLENMDAIIGPALLKKLEQESFVMQGFSIGNLSFQAMLPESVTLKNFNLDLEFGAEKLVLKKSVEDLMIPPSYYRNADEVGALLAQTYGKPLNVSGRADLLGSQKNGRIDLRVKETGLTEKEFGSVKVDADLFASASGADSLEKLLQASPDWLLKNARLTFEDKKILELAFAAQYEMLKPFGDQIPFKSAADVRANTAQQLQQEAAASPNPDTKAILEGVAKLAQQPGTLVISLNPDAPQPLANVFDAMEGSAPGAYKATAEYTPAKETPQAQTPAAPAGK